MNISQRFAEYGQRTGDYLVLNITAKIGEVAGLALVGEAFYSNASAKEGLLACAVMAGSVITDKATGGLRGY